MDKEYNQTIMVRSKLCNKSLKLKIEESRVAYAKQCNYCVKLLQQKSSKTYTLIVLLTISYSGKEYLHF